MVVEKEIELRSIGTHEPFVRLVASLQHDDVGLRHLRHLLDCDRRDALLLDNMSDSIHHITLDLTCRSSS